MSTRTPGPSTRPFRESCTFSELQMSRQHIGYTPLLSNSLPYNAMHEPPKLKERGFLSRILCCVGPLACIACVVFTILTLVQSTSSELGVNFYKRVDQNVSRDKQSYETAMERLLQTRRKLRQRSTLQRMAMLKRSKNGNGIDVDWAQKVFPHWFTAEEMTPPLTPPSSSATETENQKRLNVDAAVYDLALALSFITQSELEN